MKPQETHSNIIGLSWALNMPQIRAMEAHHSQIPDSDPEFRVASTQGHVHAWEILGQLDVADPGPYL